MSSFQARGEFEGEDDDDFAYAPPSKPAAKRKAQKQEDLQLDEDNYPAL